MKGNFTRLLVAACLLGWSVIGLATVPLDINTANAEAMSEAMVGVGPAKAEAIVSYRQSNGPFASIDDLALVKGIGARTVDMNRDRIKTGTPQAD